ETGRAVRSTRAPAGPRRWWASGASAARSARRSAARRSPGSLSEQAPSRAGRRCGLGGEPVAVLPVQLRQQPEHAASFALEHLPALRRRDGQGAGPALGRRVVGDAELGTVRQAIDHGLGCLLLAGGRPTAGLLALGRRGLLAGGQLGVRLLPAGRAWPLLE